MDVSYVISDELRQSSGRFEVSFMMDQGMSLIVKGKTDNGDVFEYQFQRNQMDFNENQ
jgi:hypothetical protein